MMDNTHQCTCGSRICLGRSLVVAVIVISAGVVASVFLRSFLPQNGRYMVGSNPFAVLDTKTGTYYLVRPEKGGAKLSAGSIEQSVSGPIPQPPAGDWRDRATLLPPVGATSAQQSWRDRATPLPPQHAETSAESPFRRFRQPASKE